MRFQRCRNGAYPVVMDVPLYDDGAALVAGVMIMRGAHGGTTNSYYIEAYISASANEALSALGVLQETVATATAIASTGYTYGKCIINDDAHYLAEYLQSTGNIVDVTSASTSTTLTTTSLEDNIDGGWVYFTEKTTAGATGAGNLRFLTASASGSATLDSAVTIDTTSDFIKILPVGHRLTSLSADSLGLLSKAAAGTSINLHIVENYIGKSGLNQAMRYATHKALSGLDKDTIKFYAEIAILSHALHIK